MNSEQTNYALLGALIAVALVLLLVVAGVGYLLLRGVSYFGRFKGLQASRKDGAMTFGGIVDETEPEPAPLVPIVAPDQDAAFQEDVAQ